MGEGQQPGHPSPPQSRHYPAAYTSVPPEIPARLLLALLDTFSSRCALVQFPRPVLSNPAPYPDASSPTGRVLRTVSWPPGGHPGACSTFWHVPRPSGASSSFLRSLNYVSGGLGNSRSDQPSSVHLLVSPSMYSPLSPSLFLFLFLPSEAVRCSGTGTAGLCPLPVIAQCFLEPSP